MTKTSSVRVVKVQREKLVACLTCPICNDLFREATTISECLHTFCKQCIYEKIIDEESHNCPVCKTDLGVAPMEKLRADNSYEDIKAKLFPSGSKKPKARAADINVRDAGFEEAVPFPSETRKGKAPEVGVPSISSPGRRKKRHLSLFVTRTPVATTSTSTSGKRYFTRKSSARQGKPASVQEKPVCEHGNYHERLEMAMKLKGDAAYTNQNAIEKSSKLCVEHNSNNIAVATQPKRRMLPNLNDEPEDHNSTDELGNHDEATPEPSTSVPIVKGQRGRKGKARFEPEAANNPAKYVVLEPINFCDVVRCKPIWFSLEAYTWKGYAPLPQIPSSYLRVKDGNVPSTFIKKYLVKKLNLQSEEEVEILMWGRPIHPALQLNDLVEIWSEKMPADEEIDATIGSSAEDYVMAITYCRKTLQSW